MQAAGVWFADPTAQRIPADAALTLVLALKADRRSRVYAGLDPGCVPDPMEWLSDGQHSAVMCFERDPERAAAELRRVVRRDGATCRQVDS